MSHKLCQNCSKVGHDANLKGRQCLECVEWFKQDLNSPYISHVRFQYWLFVSPMLVCLRNSWISTSGLGALSTAVRGVQPILRETATDQTPMWRVAIVSWTQQLAVDYWDLF